MTKLIYRSVLCFLLVSICTPHVVSAQFEGKIVYKVSYSTDDMALLPFLDFFPKTSEIYISGSNSRVQQNISGGGQQVYINRRDEDIQILLMRYMGEDIKVVLNAKQISSLEQLKPAAHKKVNETKTILDIACKKTVAMHDGDTLGVYYNESLFAGSMLPQFESLNGLILEYETVHNGLHMHFKAIEIVQDAVAEDVFEVNSQVKEVSFEDFARAFAYKKDS